MINAIQIDRHRVRRWAEFSGDYNPIHFDESAARALGVGGVVAHGMIAATLCFQRLWDHGLPGQVGRARCTLSAKLRRPIVVDERIRMITKPERNRVSCALIGEDGTTKVGAELRVARERAGAGEAVACGPAFEIPSYSVPAREVEARAAELAYALPECRSFWLALASCFFSEFLRRAIEPLRRTALGALEDCAGGSPVAVQTSCSVTVEPDAEQRTSDANEYSCRFEPGTIVVIGEACVGDVTWTLSSGRRRLLETSIGLLLKRTTTT